MNSNNVIYLADYYKNVKPQCDYDHVVISCGIFKVEYDVTDKMPPKNSFGLYHWKSSHVPIAVSFFENNVLLFTKEFARSPSIVIHGDGQTRVNTFFTFNENYKLNIYNMNNEIVKSPCVGYDIFVEFKRVNNLYAIAHTEEICTYDPFTSLINLDIFFGLVECDKHRPYDNSRIHVPLTKECQNNPSIIPIVATQKGFIVENINDVKLNYDFSEPNLVLYEDAFCDTDNAKIDFYEDSNSVDIFNVLEIENNTANKIMDSIHETGGVNLKINENDAGNVLEKIADAYSNLKNPLERTFAIIKPDAVCANYVDNIKFAIYKNNFKIINSQFYTFNNDDVSEFYSEHINKEYFHKLTKFMTSGPSLLLVLEKENAIKHWRKLIGPTNVAFAKISAPHTMRALYGNETHSSKNACHGSDSFENAKREIDFFYNHFDH